MGRNKQVLDEGQTLAERTAALYEEAPDEPVTWIVTSGCVNVTIEEGKNGAKSRALRVVQGGKISAPPSNETIRVLLNQKAIALFVEGEVYLPLTARAAAAAQGALDDPVEAPRQEVLPMAQVTGAANNPAL